MFEKILSRSQLYNAFFGPRQPEPGTIFLLQKRVYILPTRPGLTYALALAVMLIGSINYNLSLFYPHLPARAWACGDPAYFPQPVHLHITPAAPNRCSRARSRGSNCSSKPLRALLPLAVASGGRSATLPRARHHGEHCGRGATARLARARRITMDTRFPLACCAPGVTSGPTCAASSIARRRPPAPAGAIGAGESASWRGQRRFRRIAALSGERFAAAYTLEGRRREARTADQGSSGRAAAELCRGTGTPRRSGPRGETVAPDALGALGRPGRIALWPAPAWVGTGAGRRRAAPPQLPAGARAV